MRNLVYIVLFVGISSVWGQEAEGSVYARIASDGNGINIRWSGEEIIYREGVIISRMEQGSNWERLTATPILPPVSKTGSETLSESSTIYFDAFLEMPENDYKESIMGVLTLVESIRDLELAKALNILYQDNTVVTGNTYKYKVEAKRKQKTVLLGETDFLTMESYQPLSAPDSVVFERKKTRVQVQWKVEEDKHYAYNFFLKKEGGEYECYSKEISSGALAEIKKHFVEFPVSKDTVYHFKLEGIDYFGGKTVISEEFIVPLKDFEAPIAPVGIVEAKSKEQKVQLSWNKSAASDFSHYNIYKRLETEPDTAFQKINDVPLTISDTLFMDKVNDPGIYFYKIGAIDKTGNEALSLAYIAQITDIIPPPIPTKVTLEADTGLFKLSWADHRTPDFKGYEILRSVSDHDNSDNKFMPITQAIDTNYFEIPMAENVRNPFAYVVVSVDTLLNKSQHSEIVIGQLPDVIAPVPPFIKEVVAEENTLIVQWLPNQEKDLVGYNIYRKAKSDTLGFTKVNGILIPASLYTYADETVNVGTSYEYYLEAVDQSKLISEPSNHAVGRIAPLPLSGDIVIVKEKYNELKKELSIEWSLDSLKNEAIISVVVYRSVDGKKPLKVKQLDSKIMHFKERIQTPGKYAYHLRVYGERGNKVASEAIEITVKEED